MRFSSASCALALATALMSLAVPAIRAEERAEPQAATVRVREEIFVLRSVREKRMDPAETCAAGKSKAANPAWEDHYTFRSVATSATDGRVVNADAAAVGGIRGCFGRTSDAVILEFYGEFEINGIAGKAAGLCRTTKTDVPVTGIKLFSCAFELYDLPAAYAGGQLTTNSLTSTKLFGTVTEPEGYTQVSIATIRLWKK